MPPSWCDTLGNWGLVAWAEAVDLARGHSKDCNHLAATDVGRCKSAVMVGVVVVVAVVARAAVAEVVVEEGYEREGR